MKRYFMGILFALMMVSTVLGQDIKLNINNNVISPAVAPVQENGTTLVPLRVVSENLGASVEWDGLTQGITIVQDATEIKLTIGDKKVSVNGNVKELAVAPRSIKGSTMVPIRFISENLNSVVNWDSEKRIVVILNGQTLIDKGTEVHINKTKSEVHFIDTGNSDSVLIIDNNKAMIIDGGDNKDEARVVEYLKNQGVTTLDYVVCTHPHADHVGGLDAVVKAFDVKKVLIGNGDADTKTYRDFVEAAVNKGLQPSVPLEASKFKLGDGTIEFFNTKAVDNNLNNTSLVIRYTTGDTKFLFMGDAEKEVERSLNLGKVDVLKVGHHGSESSSTENFLDMVKPKHAVILVGEGNQYGHPSKRVLTGLERVGAKIYRTDELGNVIFKNVNNVLSIDSTGMLTVPKIDIPKKPDEPKKQEEQSNKVENIVSGKLFVTGSGKKYHRETCRYVNGSSREITVSAAKASGYEPCKVCTP